MSCLIKGDRPDLGLVGLTGQEQGVVAGQGQLSNSGLTRLELVDRRLPFSPSDPHNNQHALIPNNKHSLLIPSNSKWQQPPPTDNPLARPENNIQIHNTVLLLTALPPNPNLPVLPGVAHEPVGTGYAAGDWACVGVVHSAGQLVAVACSYLFAEEF